MLIALVLNTVSKDLFPYIGWGGSLEQAHLWMCVFLMFALFISFFCVFRTLLVHCLGNVIVLHSYIDLRETEWHERGAKRCSIKVNSV